MTGHRAGHLSRFHAGSGGLDEPGYDKLGPGRDVLVLVSNSRSYRSVVSIATNQPWQPRCLRRRISDDYQRDQQQDQEGQNAANDLALRRGGDRVCLGNRDDAPISADEDDDRHQKGRHRAHRNDESVTQWQGLSRTPQPTWHG
jgi:hypothetical protein